MIPDPAQVAAADFIKEAFPGVPVFAGPLEPSDVEARVDIWHGAREGHPAASVPLHEWLGMTWEQYAAWVRDSTCLPADLRQKLTERPGQ